MLGANTQPINQRPGPALVERRNAARFEVPFDKWVTAGGVTARLVDLSLTGAQVTSSAVLRPNERLNLVLNHDGRIFRLAGVIAWSNLEFKNGQPRYRAGLKFDVPAPDALRHVVETRPRASRPSPVAEVRAAA